MRVDIQNPYNFTTLPGKADIEKWVDEAIINSSQKSVVLRFVDETESRQLNFQYREKNTPTNVLSFPNDLSGIMADIDELKSEGQHLGDLVLCEPVVKREAKEQHKTLHQHWAHMIVHGVLHLQGYDHIDDKHAAIMENLEIKILQKFGFENPYLDS